MLVLIENISPPGSIMTSFLPSVIQIVSTPSKYPLRHPVATIISVATARKEIQFKKNQEHKFQKHFWMNEILDTE